MTKVTTAAALLLIATGCANGSGATETGDLARSAACRGWELGEIAAGADRALGDLAQGVSSAQTTSEVDPDAFDWDGFELLDDEGTRRALRAATVQATDAAATPGLDQGTYRQLADLATTYDRVHSIAFGNANDATTGDLRAELDRVTDLRTDLTTTCD